jgi:hypothetical protein
MEVYIHVFLTSTTDELGDRDSAVGVGTVLGWTIRFSAWARNSSGIQNFQSGSGAHPALYLKGTGVFLRVKAVGA